MKYRILEARGVFYPQYKGFFLWNYYEYVDIYDSEFNSTSCRFFDTKQGAWDFLAAAFRKTIDEQRAARIVVHQFP